MDLQLFQSDEFELRINPVGDSFTVEAPGLARALGMREAYRLVESIPEEEKGSTLSWTPGGPQKIWHLTEPGFYRAIGQRQASRIKDAEIRAQVERFQSWVYSEVLPAIRRTGRYEVAPALPAVPQSYAAALRAAADAEEARERAQAELAEAQPKADSWDVLASGVGDLSVADAAKILTRDPAITIGRDRLFDQLATDGWVYRARSDGRWRAYQTQVDIGRLSELPQTYTNPKTKETSIGAPQLRITLKGLHELHRRLGGIRQLQIPSEAA
ncbi:phage antirepressor KilAC domain-containing protein [Nocardiopsis exhalans]|uniref:Phage antirepressor KilAC domain-containing protein n=1 Tax=Nocardiopsis exhalans TaxID=163604 RepID=A0ABY5D9B2_9ACTN|nr:phage antirepressor KilAC domain-containing protein [Nocardiopsis exhalans]USY19691.1 phage antirepressor KilAC domain-containing protein [Nocardiopsis exhalans]